MGLGTGTTVAFLLEAIARRGVRARYVATSPETASAARSLGITVETFDDLDELDLAIDGADQIAPDGWLIKGRGGAHLREKIVAAAATRFVVIADSSKPVTTLHAPVPLELRPFGLRATLRELGAVTLRDVGAESGRRRARRLPRRVRQPRRTRRALRRDARRRRPRTLRARLGE